LSIGFYKYKEKHQLVEINLYDEVQKIYNGLIKAGYTVIGTEEEFRKILQILTTGRKYTIWFLLMEM
jgi:hypothetical protein